MEIYGRTDLASEAHLICSGVRGESHEIPGISACQEILNGFSVTTVEVLNHIGARTLGKPVGKYFSLELKSHFDRGSEAFPALAETIADLIRRCAVFRDTGCVLIAALGNPDITPDALGSLAASNILITRHLKQHAPEEFAAFRVTALCRTGVLGTTGVESAVQIKTLCCELRPSLVIAVDALAGSDVKHLCRTVQICNSGISPGSGVGNNREELSEASLGVPVVAIGVPTVADASCFSDEPPLTSLFVTPRDIDSSVRSLGRLIGYGVNLALHEGLTVDDVDMLIG